MTKRAMALALGLLGAIAAGLAGCSGNQAAEREPAVPADPAAAAHGAAADGLAGAPAPDPGPCFRLVKNPVEVGEPPAVVFDAPLVPPPDETYWIETVPAGHPEHISRRWRTLDAGVARADLDALPYAAEWEVRLHDGYPRLEQHVVCRRPLTVTEIPPERIPVYLESLALPDDRAAELLAAAVPAGAADRASARRWAVRGFAAITDLVLGSYASAAGPRLALVARGPGAGPGARVDLPGATGAAVLMIADLRAAAESAELRTYPPEGGRATAIELPPDARFLALFLTAEIADPDATRQDLIAVALAPGEPRVVLRFPLSAHNERDGFFGTIKGPELWDSKSGVLDVVLLQTGHPKEPTGLPGAPTAFTCRWGGERYACGR